MRLLADRLGIYLLNSINPFRIEGQKSIAIEMMDQRDWNPPDWIVLPGGNLGNISAVGKALREMHEFGFIPRVPRLAVIQAAGAAPFYRFMKEPAADAFEAEKDPDTLATAIRIGDPVSWPKAWHEIATSGGVVEMVTEDEIADAKAQIGLAGIGCEPASAATLAGIRKLTAAGHIDRSADVVAVLTGNLLERPRLRLPLPYRPAQDRQGNRNSRPLRKSAGRGAQRCGQDRGIAFQLGLSADLEQPRGTNGAKLRRNHLKQLRKIAGLPQDVHGSPPVWSG